MNDQISSAWQTLSWWDRNWGRWSQNEFLRAKISQTGHPGSATLFRLDKCGHCDLSRCVFNQQAGWLLATGWHGRYNRLWRGRCNFCWGFGDGASHQSDISTGVFGSLLTSQQSAGSSAGIATSCHTNFIDNQRLPLLMLIVIKLIFAITRHVTVTVRKIPSWERSILTVELAEMWWFSWDSSTEPTGTEYYWWNRQQWLPYCR